MKIRLTKPTDYPNYTGYVKRFTEMTDSEILNSIISTVDWDSECVFIKTNKEDCHPDWLLYLTNDEYEIIED